jgi:hypothetical protein
LTLAVAVFAFAVATLVSLFLAGLSWVGKALAYVNLWNAFGDLEVCLAKVVIGAGV